MSDGLNKVLLFGNLGSDPELRTTAGGRAVLHLRLATSDSYLDASRVRQERTEWHDVTVWGPRGEGLAKILSKGARLLVEGRLQTSSWERDGVKRYRTEVIADNVFLASARRFEQADGLAPPEAPPPRPPVQDDIPF
jgi:single-strand DNA-binding protein